MTNFGLSVCCEFSLNLIKNPLIIILKCLFPEKKIKVWIKVDELKLLIEIFSDINEEYGTFKKYSMTAEECDEANEKGCLDDVIDFILEERKRMEKKKKEKKNLLKEMLLKDLSLVIITRIYKTIMESSNEEYKKRLSKRIKDKNIIIRIVSVLYMRKVSIYIKNYCNILRLVLNECEEISEEQRFKEIITPMLDFIKKYYMNGGCDSSSSSSSSSLSGCVSTVSDGIVLTSLEVLFFYVKKDSERQRRLLESEIIQVLFPLMIHSSSLNMKRCISRFVLMLCENERNRKNLISKWKIFEYFKPLLASLYKRVNVVMEESKSKSQLDQSNDEIKVHFWSSDQDHNYRVTLIDYSEGVESICFYFEFGDFSKIEEFLFPWQYTSLYRFYSLLIQLKRESVLLEKASDRLSWTDDLMKETINSFDIFQRMLEIPNIVLVMKRFGGFHKYFFFDNFQIIGKYVYNCWERIPNDLKVSMISSLLYFSMKYVKGVFFNYIPSDIKIDIYLFICYRFHLFVYSGTKLLNKYSDLIRSHFEKSGWTEWLIHIFKALNVLSSSPHSNIPPSLSFLSSVSSSEMTNNIIKITAITIKMLLKSNTPKEVDEYFELTSFY